MSPTLRSRTHRSRTHRCKRLPRAAAGAALAASLGIGALATVPAAQANAAPPGGGDDAIATLFAWPWRSVAAECGAVLGPKGFGAVQTSPPQESATVPGHPWWEVYQPISYKLDSRLGTRQEFADMVRDCHAAGVKVYADAVINHMTGQGGGNTGYGGTRIGGKYESPGLYSGFDFHYHPDPCDQPDGLIHDYTDRREVQNCELVALADLETESDYVRGKIADYLNDLLSLGVDGFRVDAAKHIPAGDIAAIKARLSRPAYLYQEVVPGAGEPITPGEYAGNGDLLEFTYGRELKDEFNGTGQLRYLGTFGESWGLEPGDRSVTFIDNHDTERNGSTLSYKDGAVYRLANVFQLAWPFGTPNVMSSFTFSVGDASPPSAADGHVSPVRCGSGWECQHRERWTANMVGFHNAARGTGVANWWDNGGNQIAFSRAGKGFVAINREGGALSRGFATGLPAGTYCDVLHGDVSGGACTGPTVTVDGGGQAQVSVGAMDAVAIHVGAEVSGWGQP